jgi:hypothetical protein
MRGVLEFARRLMGSIRRSRSDADLQEELRLHVELAGEEALRRALPAPDAARAARIRAGGMTQAMEGLRDQRGLPALDALSADLVFGWRQIVRYRTASVSAILSLGLALGATMAAFRLTSLRRSSGRSDAPSAVRTRSVSVLCALTLYARGI